MLRRETGTLEVESSIVEEIIDLGGEMMHLQGEMTDLGM